MPSQSAVVSSNSKYAPSYVPTAVFLGGTSGIGRAMAESFAEQTKGRANIIIVGRSKSVAEQIISSFPAPPSEEIKHEFIQCDAVELKNVHNACQVLLSKFDKINYLVLSPGGLALNREETAEGNDTSLVLRYYCRAKFTLELLPLLSKAKSSGEDARVLSILAAAKGGAVDLQDLGLKKWSFVRAMIATGNYNDIMVKVLSEEHPDIAFIHIYPGLVDTPAMRPNWWISGITSVLKPLGGVVNPDVCARFMLYALESSEFAAGGYWLDKHCEKLNLPKSITDEVVKKVWEHTLEITKTQ